MSPHQVLSGGGGGGVTIDLHRSSVRAPYPISEYAGCLGMSGTVSFHALHQRGRFV